MSDRPRHIPILKWWEGRAVLGSHSKAKNLPHVGEATHELGSFSVFISLSANTHVGVTELVIIFDLHLF